MEPTVAQLRLPAAYGAPKRTLHWADVRQRLEGAERYWLATTRPDGRPHVVPVDGVWVDGLWYFGGHPSTVHQRNLRHNQHVAINLEDTMSAVIVEGRAEWVTPGAALAARVAEASRRKYGYGRSAEAYREGVWMLAPQRVLAWQSITADATRFTFDHPDSGESR